MERLLSYPQYKKSSLQWIDRIPSHWDACKLKYVVKFNPSRSEIKKSVREDHLVSFLPMKCITTYGTLQNIENRKLLEVLNGFTYFRRNDVVLAKITPCFENGKGGWLNSLPTEIGFGTTEFIVLRAKSETIHPGFLARILSLKPFRILGADAMTGAAGQQRVPLDFVKNFPAPIPPLVEQNKIAAYLRAKDVTIARLIKIRRDITLIREYRERLILDAVTGQIDLRGWQRAADDTLADDNLAAWVGDDAAETEPEDTDEGA